MRRRWVVAGAGVAAVAVTALVAGLAVAGRDGRAGADEGGTAAPPAATASVERRDLVQRDELDGTLGWSSPRPLTITRQGTVTHLPAEGSVVTAGQALAEVDNRPVVLLRGGKPAWRDLGPSTTDGPDVRQLEENLVALGFAEGLGLTVDDDFTAVTAAAVRRWQASIGVEATGTVALGEVVFLPGPVRMGAHEVAVGDAAGGVVATVTGTERVVTVDLDADRQGLVAEGDAVGVELPDGTVAAGTVADVADVVETEQGEQGSRSTVEVSITLDDPAAAGDLDGAPVTVLVATDAAEDVLAVPVHALLALAEGGYAVERVVPGGTELVAVDPGASADGWVEVTGGVAEGDEVVVAS